MKAYEVYVEFVSQIVAANKDEAEKAVRSALSKMFAANIEDFIGEIDSVWTVES